MPWRGCSREHASRVPFGFRETRGARGYPAPPPWLGDCDVDFLLECIGFPPDQDLDVLARLTLERGEPVAWRGPRGEHMRLALAPGLDLRLDREEGREFFSLYPHFQSDSRRRIAVLEVREVHDAPYDALLIGTANPLAPASPAFEEESYPLSCVLTDARRLPAEMEPGHVLAVSIAGFAVDVERVAADLEGARDPGAMRFEGGGWIAPLGGAHDPGGCVELGLRVLTLQEFENPISGATVTRIEADAPGRPLTLFLSPWQLEVDRIPRPEPGTWIVGTFLLSGRVAGGLASPTPRLRRSFG